MNLKDILKEIEDTKTVANQDLSQVDPRARTYKTGQVNSAKTKLEQLYINYKNVMLDNAIFILVTGAESGSFAKIAKSEFKCFEQDGKLFYKDIVKELNPQLYRGKNMSSSVFDVIGNVVEDKMIELDVIGYNAITFSSKYARTVNSESEMVELVQQTVNDTIGSEVIGLDVLERISKLGVNSGYKSKLVPIVLHSEDESFIDGISSNLSNLNGRVVKIAAGDVKLKLDTLVSLKKISEDTVGKALKKIAANA